MCSTSQKMVFVRDATHARLKSLAWELRQPMCSVVQMALEAMSTKATKPSKASDRASTKRKPQEFTLRILVE